MVTGWGNGSRPLAAVLTGPSQHAVYGNRAAKLVEAAVVLALKIAPAATLELGGRSIPAGPCELEQSTDTATLLWREAGRQRCLDIDVEALQALLAGGQLRREEAV